MTTIPEREFQCPARRGATCGMIDMSLGWKHALEMEVCDSCFKVGGPYGVAASDLRAKFVQVSIATLKRNGLQNYPPELGKVVLDRHAEASEVETIKAQVAESERTAALGPTFKRWGIVWRGIRPWYEWPFRAAWQGLRAFKWEWTRLYRGGCGCHKARSK